MVQENAIITSATGDLITGDVNIKMKHTVTLDDGRELQDASKPSSVYINFTEVLKTDLVTPEPVEENKVVGKNDDGTDIIEKFTPVKNPDRREKYNDKLSVLSFYLGEDSRVYMQVKSAWTTLLLEKAAADGEEWVIA